MNKYSLWDHYSLLTEFPALKSDLKVDVAVIGGGICGLTCAQLLSSQGYKVAVLESNKVGGSNTGHSTGNLYAVYGELLNEVNDKYGPDVVQKIINSRREAVHFIEKNCETLNIDCDFIRVPWHYFSHEADADKNIEHALAAAKKIHVGLPDADLHGTPFKHATKVMRVDDQAQFNPLRYVQGLALEMSSIECLIFENTTVTGITEEKDHSILQTKEGKLTATYVIHATHTPKGIMSYHTTLGPYREYGIACRLKDRGLPPGIFLGYFEKEEIISSRIYERDGERFLIVVGGPHKVGQGDSKEKFKMLEAFSRKYFNIDEVAYRWGGQHYKPADSIPYIGPKSKGSHTYIATGFSTHGLTYGTVAAQLISDLIMNKKNLYAEVYDPGRFTPVKAAPNFIKENVNVFVQYVRDYFHQSYEPFSKVKKGEGKIIDYDGEKLAVFRDRESHLQVCSAVCTHMGCVVHWNKAEQSWDCPCHGSRFDTSGEVLEGPAFAALKKIEILTDKQELHKNSGKSEDQHFIR